MKTVFDQAEIHHEFAPKLMRYLKATFNTEDAEDLLQEIFIKIYKSINNFKQEASLNTWVYRIATNAMIDKLRSKEFMNKKANEDLQTRLQSYDNSHFSPLFDKEIEKEEMFDCIRQFIDQLTEKNKIVFILSEYEGLTNPEIADVLQISLASVKIRLHRAREALKLSLGKNCHIYYDDGEIVCEPI